MWKKIFLCSVLILASCVSISVDSNAQPTAQPDFVTSTLMPTQAGYVPPTLTPVPEATITPTRIPVTAPANCTDSAVLVRDVTIPDNTQVKAGEKFTKTWEFINNGTCPWIGYTLKFSSGDKMNAPLSALIPDTLAKERVEASVELTAPASNGTFTGYFTLNDANGNALPIGTEKTFWVKIIVGSGAIVPTTSGGNPTQAVGITPVSNGGGANCSFSQNAGYVNQIASLINAERANAGLPQLTINAELSSAAQGHAADMACNSSISHTGSDGSSAYGRVLASGYSGQFYEEIIYGGGGPEAAMSWWMSDKIHRDAILNPNTTEMGVGYAYFSNGAYGDYITVDFGG
ncbi:MAG TPA: CAP domain-containing protein [Anaerolineales bacterium]|nr:CAP domain-containing protein [Anaerolineales bacterium]